MPVELIEQEGSNIVKCIVTGKLKKEDFERWVPQMVAIIQRHSKVYLLVEMRDFDGWELEAWWERVKFDMKHFNDVERIAVVVDTDWHEWLDRFSSPISIASTRYFGPQESEQALTWLKGNT